MNYKERFKQGEEDGQVTRVTPSYFEFEKPGDEIIGKLVGKSEVDSGFGTGVYNQYLVDTDDGLVKFALGGATDRELEPILRVGGIYRFEFKGQEKLKGGKKVNQFVVDYLGMAVECIPESDTSIDKETGEVFNGTEINEK